MGEACLATWCLLWGCGGDCGQPRLRGHGRVLAPLSLSCAVCFLCMHPLGFYLLVHASRAARCDEGEPLGAWLTRLIPRPRGSPARNAGLARRGRSRCYQQWAGVVRAAPRHPPSAVWGRPPCPVPKRRHPGWWVRDVCTPARAVAEWPAVSRHSPTGATQCL